MLPSAWSTMLLVFTGLYCWHNGVAQDILIFFCKAPYRPVDSQTPLVHGVVLPKGQDLHFLQPAEIPWNGSTNLGCINSSRFCNLSKLAEGTLCSIVQVSSEQGILRGPVSTCSDLQLDSLPLLTSPLC